MGSMAHEPFELTDAYERLDPVVEPSPVGVLGLAHGGSRSHGTSWVFDDADPKPGFRTPDGELLLMVVREDWDLLRYGAGVVAWREASPKGIDTRYANRVPEDTLLLGPTRIPAMAVVDVEVAFNPESDNSGPGAVVARTVTFAAQDALRAVLVPLPPFRPAFAFVSLTRPRWRGAARAPIQAGITGMVPECSTARLHTACTEEAAWARLIAKPPALAERAGAAAGGAVGRHGGPGIDLDLERLLAGPSAAGEVPAAPLVVRSGALVLALAG